MQKSAMNTTEMGHLVGEHLDALDDIAKASPEDLDEDEVDRLVRRMKEAGRLLIQARQSIPNEQWQSWCAEHQIDEYAARDLMLLEAWRRDPSDPTIVERLKSSWDAMPEKFKDNLDSPELKIFWAIMFAGDREH